MPGSTPNVSRNVWIAIAAAATAVILLIILFTSVIDPAPPRSFRLATGSPGGAYAAGGQAIAQRLEGDGIRVELVETSGSVENFALLTAEEGGVDAAILQGGVGVGEAGADELVALGALFFEPFFLFVRADADVSDIRDLSGLTIATGSDGSGMRALTTLLLEDNGVAGSVTLDDRSGQSAADALLAGEVDAVVYVTSPDRPYVRQLMVAPQASLVSIDRSEAYERLHRYLSGIVLPRGVVDLATDTPARDITLIAPAASIVTRRDLHPAIQELLIDAAGERYRHGDVISDPGFFPNRDLVGFELADEAAQYFDRGGRPNFLQRFLPFWAANMVERLWVLAIPLATLMYPLVRAAPPVYRWQIRRRIHVWYRDVRRLERLGADANSPEELQAVRDELARMLLETRDIKVPLPYNDDVFRLRSHIRLVDQIISNQPVGDNVITD